MPESQALQPELFYRSLFANALDGVLITDENGWIQFASASITTLLGFAPEEIKGTNTFEYTHPDDKELAYTSFKDEVMQAPRVKFISIRLRQKSGDWIWTMVRGHNLMNDPHVRGIVIYCSDDTMRRQADEALLESEKRLQESEQFYRNLSYYSLDGIVLTDREGILIYSGPSVERIAGYKPEELIGRHLFEFIHPDDIPLARNEFTKELNRKSRASFVSVRLRFAPGQWVWCIVRGHNLLHTPGINAMLLYFTNDSKRKEAEDRLRHSEEEFRKLIGSLQMGIIVQNAKGELIFANKSAQEIIGMSDQALQGTTTKDPRWKVIHDDGTEFPWNERPSYIALQTGKPVRDVTMGVWRPDKGSWVWTLTSAEPNLDENGNVINVVVSFTDITEQKRLARQLMQQELLKQKQLTQATIDGQEKERLEIGKELHDNINQHLSTTRLYLEVAREKASGEVLEMINYSHQTLASIINQIRLLSQSLVPPTLGDLGLVESVQELCDTLKRTHKYQAEVYARHFNEDVLPDSLQVMLFRIVQEQVNNIIRHAEARKILVRLQSDAEYIVLTITDDGKGFDPSSYKKGLGFSNISNRAGLFNGQVQIDSAPGTGCVLTVSIPLDTQPGEDDLI